FRAPFGELEIGMRTTVVRGARLSVRIDGIELGSNAGVRLHAAVILFAGSPMRGRWGKCGAGGMVVRPGARFPGGEEHIALALFDSSEFPGGIGCVFAPGEPLLPDGARASPIGVGHSWSLAASGGTRAATDLHCQLVYRCPPCPPPP